MTKYTHYVTFFTFGDAPYAIVSPIADGRAAHDALIAKDVVQNAEYAEQAGIEDTSYPEETHVATGYDDLPDDEQIDALDGTSEAYRYIGRSDGVNYYGRLADEVVFEDTGEED